MNYWLMKTEPDVFSFDDLVKAPKRTTSWEGVRNYQARNYMRDGMKLGDRVLIYHSNVEEPGVVGVAEVVREAHSDKSALDPKSEYFDEKALKRVKDKGEECPWILVDVKATHVLKKVMTRALLSAESKLNKMVVLQRGSRLSVQPVTAEEFSHILKVGGTESV